MSTVPALVKKEFLPTSSDRGLWSDVAASFEIPLLANLSHWLYLILLYTEELRLPGV